MTEIESEEKNQFLDFVTACSSGCRKRGRRRRKYWSNHRKIMNNFIVLYDKAPTGTGSEINQPKIPFLMQAVAGVARCRYSPHACGARFTTTQQDLVEQDPGWCVGEIESYGGSICCRLSGSQTRSACASTGEQPGATRTS